MRSIDLASREEINLTKEGQKKSFLKLRIRKYKILESEVESYLSI